MTRELRALLPVVVLVSSAALAQSVIYTWTDEDGDHYTDDRSAVPKGVKPRVTKGDTVSTVTVQPAPVVAPVVQPAAVAVVADTGPSDEERWRTAFRDARNKVKDLEDDIESARKVVEEVNGMPVIGRVQCGAAWGVYPGQVASHTLGYRCWNGERQERMRLKLEHDRRTLVRAKEELADLERRASFESVPLEWRR